LSYCVGVQRVRAGQGDIQQSPVGFGLLDQALEFLLPWMEVVPGLVELEVAVPHLRLAEW